MIIVKLEGGIGNQMFQYALGRTISFLHNIELTLDLSNYENNKFRTFQLDCYNIQYHKALPHELRLIIDKSNLLSRKLAHFCFFIRNTTPIGTYQEKGIEFDPNVLKVPNNIYIKGYWQSEKYFKSISEIIRNDFQIIKSAEDLNVQLMEKINSENSVSIHIRHGDYINDSKTHAYHGVCHERYYHHAINTIETLISDPHYYFFTDDPQWTNNKFSFMENATIIDWNSDKPYEDLRLMSKCKHHIIANSSFSWWGAWLGKSDNQIVIAPEPWFNNKDINTSDLYIDNWIRIPKNEHE